MTISEIQKKTANFLVAIMVIAELFSRISPEREQGCQEQGQQDIKKNIILIIY